MKETISEEWKLYNKIMAQNIGKNWFDLSKFAKAFDPYEAVFLLTLFEEFALIVSIQENPDRYTYDGKTPKKVKAILKEDAWCFPLDQKEIANRTRISEQKQSRIVKSLKNQNMISVIRKNAPPSNHYTLNMVAITRALLKITSKRD